MRTFICIAVLSGLVLVGCGGGGGGGSGSGGGGGGTTEPPIGTPPPSDGLTARLTAESSDLDGDSLTYAWKVTAGTLSDSSAPTVDWTVPTGGGLHFAYLTVSDGRGGYAERQYALELGSPTGPAVISTGRLSMYSAPSTPEIVGGAYRSTFVVERSFTIPGTAQRVDRKIPIPDVFVQVLEYPFSVLSPIFRATTDLRGEATFPKLNADVYQAQCAIDDRPVRECAGESSGPNGEFAITDRAVWEQSLSDIFPIYDLYGHVSLLDGKLCGITNHYKNLEVTAAVSLLDSSGRVISGPRRVNAYGDYALPISNLSIPFDSKLIVTCGLLAQEIPIPNLPQPWAEPLELSVVLANRAPFVSEIQARVDGLPKGLAVADDPLAPSSKNPRTDHFLTYKGIDTPQTSCAYYRSIGATPTCDADGNMVDGAIQFDEWKRIRKLAPYNGTNTELQATYVNKVDLNLIRDMHAVNNGPNDFAFYVCNHPGPSTDSQADTDAAIAAARAGRNRVACVAMDLSVTPGVNSDAPFTKFYVFGPSGDLLPSVNLDGRGEKYIPGSCVICHGGDQYSGRFPTTTAFASINGNSNPSGNLGAKFLPFDIGNFAFSSGSGLTRSEQEPALKRLNLLVRDTEPSVPQTAIKKLIDGWYGGNADPNQFSPFNEGYIPQEWLSGTVRTSADDQSTALQFYSTVVAKSCRTCHVALPNFDWDSQAPFGEPFVCGGSSKIHVNGTMPNSKVTFDLMWKRAQQPGQVGGDFSALLSTHLGCGAPISEPRPNPAYSAK